MKYLKHCVSCHKRAVANNDKNCDSNFYCGDTSQTRNIYIYIIMICQHALKPCAPLSCSHKGFRQNHCTCKSSEHISDAKCTYHISDANCTYFASNVLLSKLGGGKGLTPRCPLLANSTVLLFQSYDFSSKCF